VAGKPGLGKGATTTTAAPVTSTSTTTTTAPAHPMTVLVNQKGTGPATTEHFTVGSSWMIAYFVDCDNLNAGGPFKLSISGTPPTTVVSVTLSSTSSNDVAEHKAGAFALTVASSCSWQVQVIAPKS
jgi:hypothetical protein